MDLRKVSRKIRRKYGVGLLAILGAENLAREVKDAWMDKRSPEWVENYNRGIQNPDWTMGEANLEEWYRILETDVAPRLRQVVMDIYEQARKKYKAWKAQNAKTKGESMALGRVVEVVVP